MEGKGSVAGKRLYRIAISWMPLSKMLWLDEARCASRMVGGMLSSRTDPVRQRPDAEDSNGDDDEDGDGNGDEGGRTAIAPYLLCALQSTPWSVQQVALHCTAASASSAARRHAAATRMRRYKTHTTYRTYQRSGAGCCVLRTSYRACQFPHPNRLRSPAQGGGCGKSKMIRCCTGSCTVLQRPVLYRDSAWCLVPIAHCPCVNRYRYIVSKTRARAARSTRQAVTQRSGAAESHSWLIRGRGLGKGMGMGMGMLGR